MPSWETHNYWCKELGIREDIASDINLLIDFPKEWIKRKLGLTEEEIKKGLRFGSTKVEYINCRENLRQLLALDEIVKKWEAKGVRASVKFGHDFGRRRKWQTDILLICAYEYYGIQGIKAAILHHILDYIESIAEKYSQDEILRKVEDKFSWLTYPLSSKKVSQKYYNFSLLISESAKDVLSFVRERFNEILTKLR